MGHEMIARAETHPLHHCPQHRCRPNKPVVQQIGVRQMPGTTPAPITIVLII
jgi:hypothetical protein